MHFKNQKGLAAVFIGLALASCKERGPVIDFGAITATDTTYTVATAPAPQLRTFLIEDFSGIRCANCIAGHEFITSAEDLLHNRIAGITMHVLVPGYTSSEPHFDITPLVDFRTQDGTSVYDNIYHSPGALPTIGISRTLQNGSISIQNANQQLQALANTPTPVNIDLTSVYDATGSKSIVKVAVSYTGAVSKKQTLTVAMVEDNLSGPQDNYDNNLGHTVTINPYTHNHILRKIFTAPTGSSMIDSIAAKAPGRIYERTFIIDVEGGWNPENCSLIAFVANNETGDKEVLQAAKVKLKQ